MEADSGPPQKSSQQKNRTARVSFWEQIPQDCITKQSGCYGALERSVAILPLSSELMSGRHESEQHLLWIVDAMMTIHAARLRCEWFANVCPQGSFTAAAMPRNPVQQAGLPAFRYAGAEIWAGLRL